MPSLFLDARDQDEIKKELVGWTNEKLPAVSSAEKALLEIYNKDPEELETLFSEKGWRTVGASLADKPSADFQCLIYECLQQLSGPQHVDFQPGEYISQATMRRRNIGRSRDVRQFAGHKVDGVAIAAAKMLELLVIEAAKKDEGPNVTKALDDRMKICKLTKDMLDLIRSKARHNVRQNLATVGTQCVLEVLTTVLMIRKALLTMASNVASSMIGSIGLVGDADPVDNDVGYVAATMTSPQLLTSSPSLSTEHVPKLQL
ncbi:hypothetical protein BG006_008801 [Podila minutissima]|uniref:Uncharacterized protein n=1 Tax=Podila minutissima TaxID=64525 RepID=A0A9P5SRR8_9FUNG|nr:hypothetical protein BG006_008801 [Podila minutissima]